MKYDGTTSIQVDRKKVDLIKSKGYNLQEIFDQALNNCLKISEQSDKRLLFEKQQSIETKEYLEKQLKSLENSKKEEIEALKTKIKDTRKLYKNQTKIINEELEIIDNTLKMIDSYLKNKLDLPQKKNPKYYSFNKKSNSWLIQKEGTYFGIFKTEEEAKKVVEFLKKNNWDKELFLQNRENILKKGE